MACFPCLGKLVDDFTCAPFHCYGSLDLSFLECWPLEAPGSPYLLSPSLSGEGGVGSLMSKRESFRNNL